jgi:glutathione S-transferase
MVSRKPPMLELYQHGSSTCAAKVRFLLMEKKLAYESHYVDLLKGEQFRPEYLALNPWRWCPRSCTTARW